MANDATVNDIRKNALQLAGELSDGTSDYDVLSEEQNGIKDMTLMNDIYKALYEGGTELDVTLSEPFDWLRSEDPEILTLIPPFETGSVSLTNGSTSGTFSVAPTGLGSLVGHYLRVTSRDHVYRIVSHTADSTSFTLDQGYLEETGAALDFKVIKLDYALTTKMARIIAPLMVYKYQFNEDALGEIAHMDLVKFNREYPRFLLQSGVPTRFTIVSELDEKKTIRFNRYPATEKIRVEVSYIPSPERLVAFDFVDGDVSAASDTITETAHGLSDGQIVQLTSTGTLPAGLSPNTSYYVVESTANAIKLALTKGGAAIDITAAAGGGTHTLASVPRMPVGERKLLRDYVVHYILVDKSDPRADHYLRVAQAKLQAMVAANRREKQSIGKDRGRLIARLDQDYGTIRNYCWDEDPYN